jgi:hypothetical protein
MCVNTADSGTLPFYVGDEELYNFIDIEEKKLKIDFFCACISYNEILRSNAIEWFLIHEHNV